MQRGVRRDRSLRRAGVGAQSQVGAKHIAVSRPLRHELHQRLRQPHENGFRVARVFQQAAVLIVEDDEVDVARVVEFARAMLTHGDDDKTGLRVGVVANGEFWPVSSLGKDEAGRGLQGRIGKPGQGGGHGLAVPGSGNVGHRHKKRHAVTGNAQVADNVGIAGRVRLVLCKTANRGEHLVWRHGQSLHAERRIAPDKAGQKR
jgi:hypothetical protein